MVTKMKGLELSRKYYEAYGKELLARFGQIKSSYAVGLVGRGSECFGYDDTLSRDHDFGPSFCIWLEKESYKQYGRQLQDAYDSMPGGFLGFPGRTAEETGAGRVGVLCVEDFYYGLLGTDCVPVTNREWLALSDENLASATNGRVFADPCGHFSHIRDGLLAYYPEDVRLKKITARMARASRAGQYNYARAMKRKDRVAAELFLQEFIRESMQLVYLLNRKYAPFDKWLHRGMRELAACSEVGDMIALFYQIENPEKAWEDISLEEYRYTLNTKDGRVLIVEAICGIIVQELHAQGLSSLSDNFLQSHLPAVTEKIQDEAIRKMQFLEG